MMSAAYLEGYKFGSVVEGTFESLAATHGSLQAPVEAGSQWHAGAAAALEIRLRAAQIEEAARAAEYASSIAYLRAMLTGEAA